MADKKHPISVEKVLAEGRREMDRLRFEEWSRVLLRRGTKELFPLISDEAQRAFCHIILEAARGAFEQVDEESALPTSTMIAIAELRAMARTQKQALPEPLGHGA